MKNTTLGGILLIASTIFIALFNYVLSITLSWLLPPAQYGAIGVSQSLVFIGSWFLIAGFPWVATQALARVKADEIETVYPLLNSILWANSALGVIVAGGLWLAVWLGIFPLDMQYRTLVSWVAVVIVLLSVRLAITPVLQGRLQFARLSLVTTIEVIVQFSVAVSLVYAGYGAVGALLGFVAGATVSLIIALWLTKDVPFWRLPKLETALFAQLRPAIPLLIANLSGVLLVNVDLLALRFLITGQDELIGYYQVVAVLARIPYYISQSANAMIFPLIARHAPDSEEADRIGQQSFKLVLSLVFSLCLVLMAAPDATIAFFFPPLYLQVAPTLRILALSMGMIILAQTIATFLQARNQSKLAAQILPIASIVQMLAAVWLIPRYGLMGAALSSCVAGAVALLGMLLMTQRRFSKMLRLPSRDWLRQVGAFLLLGTVSAALPLLGRVSTALWITTALALYTLSLFWLRLFDFATLPSLPAISLPFGKRKRVTDV